MAADLPAAPRAPGGPLGATIPALRGSLGLRSTNAVVLALVVALLDLEQRRARGKVRPPMRTRQAA
jgi:hypothetical protein